MSEEHSAHTRIVLKSESYFIAPYSDGERIACELHQGREFIATVLISGVSVLLRASEVAYIAVLDAESAAEFSDENPQQEPWR